MGQGRPGWLAGAFAARGGGMEQAMRFLVRVGWLVGWIP